MFGKGSAGRRRRSLMDISFIIPAYNASKTIVACLDSIYALPLSSIEYEVIVIDDCSSDDTPYKLQQYQKSRSNMKVIFQAENHRQGAARNCGVKAAKGEYIVFVDSDDMSEAGIVDAYRTAGSNKAEMVAIHFHCEGKDGLLSEKEPLSFKADEVFSGRDLQKRHPYWNSGPCAYLYSKEFLQKVNYPFAEDVLYEDSDFVYVHLYHAQRMCYSKECGYRVRYNTNSTVHTLSYKHLADYFLLGTRMINFYNTIKNEDQRYADMVLEGGQYNMAKSLKRLYKLSSGEEIRLCFDRIDDRCRRYRYFQYTTYDYLWTRWTKTALRHRHFAIITATIASFAFKICKSLS
ncbi:MAG: glycosyltransferase family 2 protein [Bacteroidales bacterium]|nr:glycosyltransferase family 2 protein [Candidatus Cacconaster merdequi]